jgi:glycosyltransferase involved in cell wall biosynthesis
LNENNLRVSNGYLLITAQNNYTTILNPLSTSMYSYSMDDFNSASTTAQPLVSVGIPTYNRPEDLRRSLECITGQTYRNLEIIVSDNASPGDQTGTVIRDFMEKDSRIKYFRQQVNIGATLNFQFVLDNANGKYFMWVADDDLCEPAFVHELTSCMEEYGDIVLAMTDVKVIASDDSVMRIEQLDSIRADMKNYKYHETCGLFFRYPTTNIFFCIYGLYRIDVVKECTLNMRSWRNYLFNSEVPFLAQIAVRGRIASIPRQLKLYRSHADSCYIKELPQVTIFDRLIRGAEIRLQLVSIVLSSKIDIQTKLVCIWSNISSWFGSMANFARILLAKIQRAMMKALN